MRKIFVAAFAFVGFILTPAVASARPPARNHQVSQRHHRGFDQTTVIKRRVQYNLQRASADLNRGQRMRLITPREARSVRAHIRTLRRQLRQSLRFDRQIRFREANRLERSVNDLQATLAQALRPNHHWRQQTAWR